MTDSPDRSERRWQVHVLDRFAEQAAERFCDYCQAVIAERGQAQVALSGGNTPKALYQALSGPPFSERLSVESIEFFQSDERMVGPEHRDSNWGMAAATLLDRVGVPSRNRRRMQGESHFPHEAASRYAEVLGFRLPVVDDRPVFDLILLGVGTDGHTASLFPGTPAVDETRQWVVANPVGQLKTVRLTLTFPVINAARSVWVLATGPNKAAIVRRAIVDRDRSLPIARVVPDRGECLWLLDPAAAAHLPPGPPRGK